MGQDSSKLASTKFQGCRSEPPCVGVMNAMYGRLVLAKVKWSCWSFNFSSHHGVSNLILFLSFNLSLGLRLGFQLPTPNLQASSLSLQTSILT